jgi:hypothetical protein
MSVIGAPRPKRLRPLSDGFRPYRGPVRNGSSGSRAVVGGRCDECLRRVENAPTVVASGRTGVRAEVVIPRRARNGLHRPKWSLSSNPLGRTKVSTTPEQSWALFELAALRAKLTVVP